MADSLSKIYIEIWIIAIVFLLVGTYLMVFAEGLIGQTFVDFATGDVGLGLAYSVYGLCFLGLMMIIFSNSVIYNISRGNILITIVAIIISVVVFYFLFINIIPLVLGSGGSPLLLPKLLGFDFNKIYIIGAVVLSVLELLYFKIKFPQY